MTPSNFSFEGVSFTVKTKQGPKTILRDLTASVGSGDVLAILGPSGAGKTTLMNVLTLQSFGGSAAGTVELNGEQLSLGMFLRHCAVVTQQDFHWAFLTAREVLAYALDLYDAGSASAAEKNGKVDEMLSSLGLTGCAETKVGNQFMRGLSGGQKRRLSIGTALLKSPSVIFMDEPTSGLDAAAAASIMKFTKELAVAANVVSICTIHQPSAAVFAGFDQVMLLSNGRCAYKGLASDVNTYFTRIGYPVPAHINTAEFMLEAVNSDFVDEQQVDTILDRWAESESYACPKNSSDSRVFAVLPSIPSKAGFGRQLVTMLRRHGTLTLRDPMLYTGRMVMCVVVMVFFSVVYIEARERVQVNVKDNCATQTLCSVRLSSLTTILE